MQRSTLLPGLLAVTSLLASSSAHGQQGFVRGESKIADDTGGLLHVLEDGDRFGASSASGFDLDGDGVNELLVGAPGDDDGGTDRGAVYVLFLKPDGSLAGEAKISALEGNFAGSLQNGDGFGAAITALGDRDNDGLLEIAVGAPGADAGGTNRGRVWILELRANGEVETASSIDALTGGFAGPLADDDAFGAALVGIGDRDGDGVEDLAVGAPGANGAGVDEGAVWLLDLNLDGSVKRELLLASGAGGFGGALASGDGFGSALAAPDDVNDDQIPDLVVGAPGDDDGGAARGAVWVVFLDAAGAATGQRKISSTSGGLLGPLADGDRFGAALGAVGDLDQNFIGDLLVGAPGADGLGVDRGAIWVLLLDFSGRAVGELRIGEGLAGFVGPTSDDARFGTSVAAMGDLDLDGGLELAVGADGDKTGGPGRGGVWTLFTAPGSQTNNPGTGVNPQGFEFGTDVPRIGKVWDPIIDKLSPPGSLRGDPIFHWVGVSDSAFRIRPPLTLMGELLIDLRRPAFKGFFMSVPGQRFRIPIPRDPNLVGLLFFTQGAETDLQTIQLTNGIDIVIGF